MGRKRRKKRSSSRYFWSLVMKKLREFFLFFFTTINKFILGLPGKVKRYILSSLMFFLSLVSFLSFFNMAGKGGEEIIAFLNKWFGDVIYIIPLVFFILGIALLCVLKVWLFAGFFTLFVFLVSVAGLLKTIDIFSLSGGKIGSMSSVPLVNLFGDIVSIFVFFLLSIVGLLSFWHILDSSRSKEDKKGLSEKIRDVFSPSRFKILKIEPNGNVVKEKQKDVPVKQDISPLKSVKTDFPPLKLLAEEKDKPSAGNIKERAMIIKKTLENFNIDVDMAEVNIGPTVTQYTLKPAEGVKLSKITGLSNNLALALAAHPIRIEAPIPGRSLVGIEVPNQIRSRVRLRGLLASPDFKKETSSLGIALGRDVSGVPVYTDLTRLPHLLVAGATGTGKTIFLNSLILSLLYYNSPESLRLILVDPKRVEFTVYNNLPHLLTPVICTVDRNIYVLNWLIDEMEKRFILLSEVGVRNIDSFNEKMVKEQKKKMPYIVLIIDELADLMAARGKDMESRVVRIAQMARAVGIHLVLATQRPSTEVITGLIKANITSRISFQLPTQIDSRTVLDSSGAEKLLGLGDLLYISSESTKPKRIQGSYISENEVKRVMDWITNRTPNGPLENDLSSEVEKFFDQQEKSDISLNIKTTKKDVLFDQARDVVTMSGKASASLLQRRLQIGYVRAARILDMLEAEGIIGPSQGSKPRKVYVKTEDREEVDDWFEE